MKTYFSKATKTKKIILSLIIAGGLTATIGLSKAATDFYSIEPENGAVSGAVSVKSDSTASGGKYLLFGTGPTTTTPTEPAPSTSTGSTNITGITYYLDCNGNDAVDGKSQINPWKSLTKASSASLSPGDGILLKRGCTWSGNLNVKWNGTTSSPVVIGAYGTGNAPIITRNTDGDDITVRGSYAVIQDLNLTATAPSKDTSGGRCNGTNYGNIHGVAFETGSNNNTVKNTTISNMYAGVYLKTAARNNRVVNNTLSNNNMMSPNRTGSDDDAGAFGVLIWGHDNEIAYNTISGSNACSPDYIYDGAALEIFSGSTPAASNNSMHHNKAINTNAFTEMGKSSSGAIPDGNIYAYNTYYTSGIENAIFMVTRGGTGSYGPINGTKAYNNTAYMLGTNKNGIYCGSCSASALVFKNNVIATSNNTPIPSGLGSGVSNNVGWVIGSSSNNPGFVNGAGQDFHLSANSPAINTGSSESLNYFKRDLDNKSVPAGGAVDAGAYEYGAVATNNKSGGALASLANKIKSAAKTTIKNIGVAISKVAVTVKKFAINIGIFFGSLVKPETASAIQADGSIVIAAVGDMNPENNTYALSPSGKNATAITAGLANGSIDAFFGLGDFQYQQGTCSTLVNAWGKLWSPVIPKTYHIAGPTHDSASATDELGYRQYFNGQCAGSAAKSAAVQAKGASIGPYDFYSFDIGNWHFAALPTAAWRYDTTKANSITAELDADLARAKAAGKHLGALYHDPYFTGETSSHGPETKVKPWIDVLDKYGVRLTLSGSQHNYERTCPVNKAGVCQTNGSGMTAFNVSTGGIGLRPFKPDVPVPSYTAVRFTNTYGWLKLTLNKDGSFTWVFNSVNGPGEDSDKRAASGETTTPPPTGDTTPPVVSISSPASGSTVSGIAQINSTATDNSGSIKKVELTIDGNTTPTFTSTASPYNFSLDTKNLSNGAHTLTVKAYDNTGNIGTKAISVNVSNASCQTINNTYGSTTSTMTLATGGKYRIWSRIKAPDENNNSFYLVVDNQCPINIGDKSITANNWTWINNRDAGSTAIDMDLTAGAHTIKLIGRENGVSLDRVLFVANLSCIPSGNGDNCSTDSDTTLPTISMTSPVANQVLNGTVNIAVLAKDNVGISKVEYYLDSGANVAFGTSTTSPFGYTWDTSKVSSGDHILRAIAYDNAGNKSTEASTIVKVADQIKPEVAITNPTGGDISGNKEVIIAATDNVSVSKVEVKLDDSAVLTTLTQAPYSFMWDTKNIPDGKHIITAYASDTQGNVGVSQPITLNITNDTQNPSTPTDLKATQVESNSVGLSWTVSTDNKIVAGYNIYRGGVFISSSTTNNFTDKNVQPNTIYNYSVSAFDSANNESAKSSVIQVTTPPSAEQPPSAPQNVALSNEGPAVVVSWSSVQGATKYYIQRNGTIIGESTTTSYKDVDVISGQTYSYVVYASSAGGLISGASASKTITTQTTTTSDTQAPSAPSNLTAYTSTNLVTLSWGGSTDNVKVVGYKIFRDNVLVGQSSFTNFGDGTVESDRTYSYYVVAVDSAGNQSEKSSVTSVTIPKESGVIRTGVVADAFIQESKSSENFGNWGSIRVDKSPRQNILMKLSVGDTNGKVITSAKLRLYANNGSTRTGGYIYKLNTNNWDESKVTWSNAPKLEGELIRKLGPVFKNSYVEVDLSDLIKTSGTYSIGFSSTSRDAAHYNSKENDSRKPELIITTN